LPERKCGFISVFQWLLGFIWKILTGEDHIQKQLLYFTVFRYNSAQSIGYSLYQESKENGLTLTELSLAFIEQQPFVTSTIDITLEQLKKILIRFK
jgi:aryl-alcohol dehydrogenase-like predicted oxidoreductase